MITQQTSVVSTKPLFTMHWLIHNSKGRYIRPTPEGTILAFTDPSKAKLFYGTRDYVDGYCEALTLALEEQFTPVLSTQILQPSQPQVQTQQQQ